MSKRRVVITGMGVITPLGVGLKQSWENLLQGKPGIRKITQFDASQFPTQIAGEVDGLIIVERENLDEILKKLYAIDGIQDTRSYVTIETIK